MSLSGGELDRESGLSEACGARLRPRKSVAKGANKKSRKNTPALRMTARITCNSIDPVPGSIYPNTKRCLSNVIILGWQFVPDKFLAGSYEQLDRTVKAKRNRGTSPQIPWRRRVAHPPLGITPGNPSLTGALYVSGGPRSTAIHPPRPRIDRVWQCRRIRNRETLWTLLNELEGIAYHSADPGRGQIGIREKKHAIIPCR